MSLRARLLVGMGVVALVLVGAAVVIARTTEAHLIDQVDVQLRDAGPPARAFGPGDRRVAPDRVGPGAGPEAGHLSSLYVGYVAGDDTIVTLFTPNLTQLGRPLPAFTAEQARDAADEGEPFTVGSRSSGARYRVLAEALPRVDAVQVLALPLSDVDAAVRRLVAVEVAATTLVVAVLGLVTSWVIRLGVRPIKQMTATATAIAGGTLSQRVPDVAPGTEAGELGLALNQMLGRIEEAFDQRAQSEARLRQFVADASHELRTPVTTVRGYAELYRGGGLAKPGELDEAMRRTEQEAVRMGALIDDLLLLARLDQGRPLDRSPVELTSLVEDAVHDARAVDPDRPVESSTDGAVTVLGDDGRLRQVVANLVGNAVVHTPPGTPVMVSVAQQGDRAVLEVSDVGPGMPPDVAARAFERFYRADPSRSRHRGGTGLGLAIVQATVAAHGGTVTLDTAPGHGTTFRVELPATAGAEVSQPILGDVPGGSQDPVRFTGDGEAGRTANHGGLEDA